MIAGTPMLPLDLMAQAIDFIEAHLQEDITVSDIAAAVSYSIYHFCRTFNQVTHSHAVRLSDAAALGRGGSRTAPN